MLFMPLCKRYSLADIPVIEHKAVIITSVMTAKVAPLKSRSLSLRQPRHHNVCLCSVTDMVEIRTSRVVESRHKGWSLDSIGWLCQLTLIYI